MNRSNACNSAWKSSSPAEASPAAGFPDSSWTIAFDSYDPRDEGRREAIFALGNGMFVTRAAAPEAIAGPMHYPGTYRVGCYDRLTDRIAGGTIRIESLVNLPNWLPLRFRIDGCEWFDLGDAKIHNYRHSLDLATGITCRELVAEDRGGKLTRIRERRLVSMADRHVAAMRFEITPLNWSGGILVRSSLDGDVKNENVERDRDYDPRHLKDHRCQHILGDGIQLSARTRQSGIRIAFALRTTLNTRKEAPETVKAERSIAHQFHATASEGKMLAVEKVAALFTSRDPGCIDPEMSASGKLASAGSFDELRAFHAEAWLGLWSRVAIDVGAASPARALRLHAFHILQTVSPHTADLDAGIPARGWHGEAYHGHIFWDDLFVFPFLNHRFPELARELLLYRYRRLKAARAAARAAGCRGAMYPWRSASDGSEVTPDFQKNLISGHWMRDPTRLQRHIGSSIVLNIWRYYLATGDFGFFCEHGAEMIVEIARFWASIATRAADSDRFEIKGVIGPDEYHNSYPGRDEPGLDNNAYTNVMAVWTLCRALDVLDRLPPGKRDELSARLHLGADEPARWDLISRRMKIAFHGDGIISQFEGFEKLREFDPERLPPSFENQRADWALEAIGESADGYQVTKQADVLTLFYLFPEEEIYALFKRLGYHFDRDGTRRTADYYLSRTTHRSSLSRVVYAGALARIDPDLSWRLYQDAMKTDLETLKGEQVAEGVHLGAMGGTLDILQRRYLGLHEFDGGLRFDPAFPDGLGRVRMKLRHRRQDIEVEVDNEQAVLHSIASNRDDIEIHHPGGGTSLKPGETFFHRPFPVPRMM